MCWLLLRAFSDDHAASWQLGDVVEVREDNAQFGSLEGLPRFYRIQIQGLPASTVKHLLEEPVSHDETDVIDGQSHTRRVVDKVRSWTVTPADLPAGARTTLQTTGVLSVTKAQARTYLKNHLGHAPTL